VNPYIHLVLGACRPVSPRRGRLARVAAPEAACSRRLRIRPGLVAYRPQRLGAGRWADLPPVAVTSPSLRRLPPRCAVANRIIPGKIPAERVASRRNEWQVDPNRWQVQLLRDLSAGGATGFGELGDRFRRVDGSGRSGRTHRGHR